MLGQRPFGKAGLRVGSLGQGFTLEDLFSDISAYDISQFDPMLLDSLEVARNTAWDSILSSTELTQPKTWAQLFSEWIPKFGMTWLQIQYMEKALDAMKQSKQNYADPMLAYALLNSAQAKKISPNGQGVSTMDNKTLLLILVGGFAILLLIILLTRKKV